MNIITRSKFPISNVGLFISKTNSLNINFFPISINAANQSTSINRLCKFQYFCNISASKSIKKDVLLHQPPFPIYQNLCWKSSKSKKKKASIEDSDDSDEEDEWVLEKGQNFKDVKARIPSLRLDAFVKAGFGLSRNKVEESFYGNKVKLNKKKPGKKSQMIHEGDSVDFIRSSTSDSEVEFGRITLIKVGEYDEGSDKISVLLRKYPKLVGNYKEDPDL